MGILEGFVCKDGGAKSGNNGERRMAGKKHRSNAFIFNIFINNPAFHFAPPISGKHSERSHRSSREKRENGSTKDL